MKKPAKPILDEESEAADPAIRSILQFLYKKKGTDFSHYKMSTVRRRILRRVTEYKFKNLKQYAEMLRKKSNEADILYYDLLIGVTSFFRDKYAFEYLKKTLIPKLFAKKGKNDTLRVWVPGCATGEEAYSLAMVIYEVRERLGLSIPFQIFATDLNARAIVKARNGEYTSAELANVSPLRLTKFFSKSRDKYRIRQMLREVCVFSEHNLLNDPAFSRMDLISCNNLLIYLDSYAQKKVISSFHFGLNEGGYLLLGKSETAGNGLFSPTHKKIKLYLRKSTEKSKLPLSELKQISEQKLVKITVPMLQGGGTARKDTLTATLDQLLLSRYVPTCVLIDHRMEVIQFRGDTSFFFTFSGKASFNLLKIIRNELLFDTRSLIQKAIKTNKNVSKRQVECRVGAETRVFDIEVQHLRSVSDQPVMLIMYIEQKVLELVAESGTGKAAGRAREKKIRRLEQELAATRAEMQTLTQEQEATIEELQSANEEIVSSNEELRTVNEELETSKEEIEATNEELISSNKELQKRNEEVESLHTYSSSILATIPDPMLILDKELKIRSANQQFLKTFKLTEDQVSGSNIYRMNDREWDLPELRQLLETVVSNKSSYKKQVINWQFSRLGDKVLHLSARHVVQKQKADQLILLIIEDITLEKKREEELKQKEKELLSTQLEAEARMEAHHASLEFLRSVFMNAPVAIGILRGPEHRYELHNNALMQLIGNRNVLGQAMREVFPEIESQGYIDLLDAVFHTGKPYHGKESLVFYDKFQNGNLYEGYFNFTYQPLFDLDGKIDGIMIVAMDVTEHVMARKKVEESEKQFVMLADNMQNLAWTADATGWIYWYNQRWYEYTGCTKEEMEGWGWQKVHDPQVLPEVLERWKQSIESGDAFEMTFPIKGADGIFRQFLTRVYPVKDDKGKVTRWFGTNTDVHDHKRFSDELEAAVSARTRELEAANRALQLANEHLNSFNYISSHDLQEPLRKIKTFSKLLLKEESEKVSSQGKDYLGRMEETVNRMQRLLEDLLTYSRTKTSDKIFEHRNLNELVKYVQKDFEPLIAEKKAVIETRNLETHRVISFQFQQLIHNLMSNSLKFSKENDAPHIVIEGAKVNYTEVKDLSLSPGKQYYRISFRDNGIGFDPEYKDKIFEIFQRLHDRDEYQGTGIGLAIVKKIVENHNGYISASARPGEGAEFNVYLPVE